VWFFLTSIFQKAEKLKIRLTSLEQTYVPNISFVDDVTGEKQENRKLPADEQISVVLKLANADQKVTYQSGYTTFDKQSKEARIMTPPNMARIVGKHVVEVKGLSSIGITTAQSLVENHTKYDEISDIVLECYNVIMGAWPVDYEKSDSDTEESEDMKLSGESTASV